MCSFFWTQIRDGERNKFNVNLIAFLLIVKAFYAAFKMNYE